VRTYKRKPKAKPLVNNGQRSMIKSELRALRLFGGDLQDAKEEAFIRMVCDGLSLGVSYVRAGFTSKASDAARNLFNQPHVQRRAEAVLEARRTQGVVTLPEVTDMLKRVFAGANSEGEYSAAHNAAFSLARLYGHVTDKATLEVLRRPSREPDAPSEQVLGDWVASLPGPVIDGHAVETPLGGPPPRAPAPLLGLDLPRPEPSDHGDASGLEPQGSGLELTAVNSSDLPNDFNGLAGVTRGMEIENGAPVGPVIGTPDDCGRSASLGLGEAGGRSASLGLGEAGGRSPLLKKRVPSEIKRVPVKKRVKSGAAKRKARKLKSEMKELFG
jgi:hypothetical protein